MIKATNDQIWDPLTKTPNRVCNQLERHLLFLHPKRKNHKKESHLEIKFIKAVR
jgi:hypothetical protein